MPHFEIKSRSIVKAVTWKLIAITITWVVIYSFFLEEAGESLKISLVAAPISLFAYYLHERLWNRVHWGKKIEAHKNDDNIDKV